MNLHPIRAYNLKLLEAGQFINSQLTDIVNLGDTATAADTIFNDYISELDSYVAALNNAILIVRKSDETVKIEEEDTKRDQALLLLKRAASVFELSHDASEKDAAISLKTLFKTYKGLSTLNYQAESLGIDNLVSDLGNSKYEPMVDLLGLGSFVTRLREANNSFKALFSGRNLETTKQETSDARKIKNEMLAVYSDFAEYVLAMAKPKNGAPVYKELLNLLNTNRSYFSDLLARRKGVAAEAV